MKVTQLPCEPRPSIALTQRTLDYHHRTLPIIACNTMRVERLCQQTEYLWKEFDNIGHDDCRQTRPCAEPIIMSRALCAAVQSGFKHTMRTHARQCHAPHSGKIRPHNH